MCVGGCCQFGMAGPEGAGAAAEGLGRGEDLPLFFRGGNREKS